MWAGFQQTIGLDEQMIHKLSSCQQLLPVLTAPVPTHWYCTCPHQAIYLGISCYLALSGHLLHSDALCDLILELGELVDQSGKVQGCLGTQQQLDRHDVLLVCGTNGRVDGACIRH